jgi:hypothetical protein
VQNAATVGFSSISNNSGRLLYLFLKTRFSALKNGFGALFLCIVNKGNFKMTTAESEKLKQSRKKN